MTTPSKLGISAVQPAHTIKANLQNQYDQRSKIIIENQKQIDTKRAKNNTERAKHLLNN